MQAAAVKIAEVLPDAFAGDAHMLLQAVYKDRSNPVQLRIDAAKAAIKFEKPALAAVADLRPPEPPQPVVPDSSEDHLADLAKRYLPAGSAPAAAATAPRAEAPVAAAYPPPQEIGQDHRQALAKRFAGALRIVEGGAAARPNGKANGPQ
jgi:hypothetical protein